MVLWLLLSWAYCGGAGPSRFCGRTGSEDRVHQPGQLLRIPWTIHH